MNNFQIHRMESSWNHKAMETLTSSFSLTAHVSPPKFLSEVGIQSIVRQMEGHPPVPVWIMFWVEMADRCFPINPRLGLKWKKAARTTNLAKELNPIWTKHYKLHEENHTWFALLHKVNKIDMREILSGYGGGTIRWLLAIWIYSRKMVRSGGKGGIHGYVLRI